MKTKAFLLTALFLVLILLAGCWNRRELGELSIVIAIGVDQIPQKNEYRVSFQIVNPAVVATGATGGGAGKATPVTVYTETGSNLFEAIRKASQKLPRQLFFSHIRIIVIGEPMARKGIEPLFDFFTRSHETRLTTHVLVARGTSAESIIRTLTPLEKLPANAVDGKIKFSEKIWSEEMSVEIDDVVRGLVSEGSEPLISGVKMTGKPHAGGKYSNIEETKLPVVLEIRGIGLFKEGKLMRWVDGPEARGLIRLKDKMKGTVMSLDCNEKKDGVAIELTGSRTEIKTEFVNGKPKFQIRIREEGNIDEIECPLDISDPEVIEKLEKEWAAETKKEVMAVLEIAKKEKSDIFGFGEAVSREYPKEWEEMKKDWGSSFAESHMEVKVDSYIRRTAMRMQPYFLKEKK
ncbi:Ger(x)C family spore germination protein [Ammoniphilus sp. 3BR4]|uniref:Ger(x)C family spore germination protein n=1 Tax=Ammoniphilus sp. 3BR4 TaxID=3158265 RepID=UPI00346731DA